MERTGWKACDSATYYGIKKAMDYESMESRDSDPRVQSLLEQNFKDCCLSLMFEKTQFWKMRLKLSFPYLSLKKKDNATSDYLNMLPQEEQKEGLRSPRLLELLELWNAVNLHFLSWWLSFFSHKCNNWDWHLRQGFEDKMTVLIKNY